LRATTIPDLNDPALILPRRRLLDEYSLLQVSGKKGGWRKLAARRRINVKYVYNFAIHGRLPTNKSLRKKLGMRPSINDMFRLPIQAMPPEILAYALEHREERE
jgi:hypothetical protein